VFFIRSWLDTSDLRYFESCRYLIFFRIQNHQVYDVTRRLSCLVDSMIFSLLVILLIILIVIGVLWIIGKIAWTLLKWLIIIVVIAMVISWLLNL
jgi:hypothetical protein